MGGLDTLSTIERVEVDNKDRPIEDIVITAAHVFVDPFAEADQEVRGDVSDAGRRPIWCGGGGTEVEIIISMSVAVLAQRMVPVYRLFIGLCI